MRFISRAGWAEVVGSAASRPCDVVGGPSSALVIRTRVSRSESFAICGGRARWTACAGELCAVGSECAKKGLLGSSPGWVWVGITARKRHAFRVNKSSESRIRCLNVSSQVWWWMLNDRARARDHARLRACAHGHGWVVQMRTSGASCHMPSSLPKRRVPTHPKGDDESRAVHTYTEMVRVSWPGSSLWRRLLTCTIVQLYVGHLRYRPTAFLIAFCVLGQGTRGEGEAQGGFEMIGGHN